jgi:alanyl-tRNA synthetase
MTTLYSWKSSYGFPDLEALTAMARERNIPEDVRSLQEELVRLRKEKGIEIKKLRKELNEEKLKNLADEMIIDLAEKTFHIPIRKNPVPSDQRIVAEGGYHYS